MKQATKYPGAVLKSLAFLALALCLPACAGKSGVRVNSPMAAPLGTFNAAQIVCGAEDTRETQYVGRLETQVMVKLKERETFKEFRLSRDPGQSDLIVSVMILDVKKPGYVGWGWGWGGGRRSSKVACDVTLRDAKTNSAVGSFSVVANPRYSSVEEALEDAATQIADYMRSQR